MFKIYRRFENDSPGAAPMSGAGNKETTPKATQNSQANQTARSHNDLKKEPQRPVQNGQNPRQGQIRGSGFDQRRTLPQNIRVASPRPQNQKNCGGSKTCRENAGGGNHKDPARKRPDFLGSILPQGLYNPKTKKLFGVLCAEDLMLVALIFLLLESDSEDNLLTVLVLLYVLVSDYIDLPDLGF